MPVELATDPLSRLKAARRLPSPPGIAIRVLNLCRREDTEIQDIADTIMSDPAISARLLKYANSSMIGVTRPVTSIRDAVLRLGLRTVKVTALGFSLASPDFAPRCPHFNLSQFWEDSFLTAVTARRLAGQFYNSNREEAFTTGLLAQIGRLALAHGLPEEYRSVLQLVEAGVPLPEAERQVLGVDHVQFGADALADWQLPSLLVEAIAHQQDEFGNEPPAEPCLPWLTYVARRLTPLFTGDRTPSAPARAEARRIVEGDLKLDERTWQRIAQEIKSNYEDVAPLFDVGPATEVDIFDLYAEAQEEVARVGMVAQLERARALEDNKVLLHRATTDALTGVANRARFDERIAELVAGLRRHHGHFALVLFDIDHFKRFNDAHGHEVGDLILKHVAQAARAALREVDLLARYGGEEFAVLSPCTDRRGACVVAIRVCKSVERMRVDSHDRQLQVTVSAGLALSSDYDQIPSVEGLVADADRQLYLSKRAGRNTWSYLGRTASKVTLAAAAP